MTKENWITVRQMEEIPLSIFFHFYLERGGVITNFMTFSSYFTRMCGQEPNVYTKNNEYKKVTYGSCLYKMFTYYDIKFGLCMT